MLAEIQTFVLETRNLTTHRRAGGLQFALVLLSVSPEGVVDGDALNSVGVYHS